MISNCWTWDRVGQPVRRSTRLGDNFDWLWAFLETILQIRRLRRSVCGAHECSAPPFSSVLMYLNKIFSWNPRKCLSLSDQNKMATKIKTEHSQSFNHNLFPLKPRTTCFYRLDKSNHDLIQNMVPALRADQFNRFNSWVRDSMCNSLSPPPPFPSWLWLLFVFLT